MSQKPNQYQGGIKLKKIISTLIVLLVLVATSALCTAETFPWNTLQSDLAPMIGVARQTLGNGVYEPQYYYEPGYGLTLVQPVQAFTPDISLAVERLLELYTAYSTATIPLDEWISVVAIGTLDKSTMLVKMKNGDIQAFAKGQISQQEIRQRTMFFFNGTRL